MADIEKFAGSAVAPPSEAPTLDPSPTSSKHIEDVDPDIVIVDWERNDPEHPFNWPRARKYRMVVIACFITALTALNSTGMSIMTTWGTDWFGTSRVHFIAGLTLYNVASSIAPLLLAPLSEHFGRNGIYQISSIINMLLFLPQVFTKNLPGFLACRWFQGMVASVGISMVGGTIADVFEARDRGQVMNLFALIIFVGQGAGGLTMGWIGERLGYQWCWGMQAIWAAGSVVINALLLRETRANTLLTRRARRLTKDTGIKHVARSDLERKHQSLAQQLRITAVRPLKFLVTEPIVSSLSLWIGLAWGSLFLGGPSTMLVFAQYGFSPGEKGSMGACIAIGGIIGYFTAFHQERLYGRAAAKSGNGRAPPEARLYWAAAGGLLFPAGMMAFAWTGRPHIPWPVPAAMLCLSYWGIYCMYLGVFNYIADAYETYSSSAQAAQGFVRNTNSGIFPLFTLQMYEKLGYPQASSLVAALGFAFAAAPFLLIRYGARLRARSPVTSQLVGNL
jgi:MFS family permease